MRVCYGAMATYQISVVNEHLTSSNEHESADVLTALKYAIRSALDIAADQVSHGSPYFGAEVRLEEGNKLIGRYVVSAGASPLKD